MLVGEPHRHQRVLAIVRRTTGREVRGGRHECLGQTVEAVLNGSQKQLALAREQTEDIGLSYPHSPRDPLYRRPMQATAGKLMHGGGDQLFTALGGGNTAARGALAILVHSDSLATTNPGSTGG